MRGAQHQNSDCEIEFESDLGIFIWEEDNTFAYSPDGRVTVTLPDKSTLTYLVEIKCPPSKKDLDTQTEEPILGRHGIPGVEGRQPLPSNYYSQVQLGMKVMGIQSTLFAVWTQKYDVGTKESVQVQVVERNEPFIDSMIDDSRDYFWKHYIPRLRELKEEVRKARELADGSLHAVDLMDDDGGVASSKRPREEEAAGSSSSSSSSSTKKKKKGRGATRTMTATEKGKMESLSHFVVTCADGAPVHIIRRFYDEEAGDAGREGQVRYHTQVSAGGFHFGKETYTVNGNEYDQVFFRHLISFIRGTDGQQNWFLTPPDPRQRQAEEAEYCTLAHVMVHLITMIMGAMSAFHISFFLTATCGI